MQLYVMNCPVCNEPQTALTLYAHLMGDHPEFLTVFLAMMVPDLNADNIMYNFDDFDDETDFNNYEYLSSLCDEIGNHYVGVSDINVAAPITIIDTEKELNCPICFENIKNVEARRITLCKHVFCGECIEEWLTKHKTCPVCKIDCEETPS